MSERVKREIDTRTEQEIKSAPQRKMKVIGMAKQDFAYAIVDAMRGAMPRELLYEKIRRYLKNTIESDGKPLVEDFDAVARELANLDTAKLEASKGEIPVSQIPRHSKAKSESAPKDPVERAMESEKNRRKAIANKSMPVTI